MRFRSMTLLLVCCLLVASTAAWADSQARIVRLSYLEGDVQLDRGDGSGSIRAFLNMPLIEGASVWTRDDARAEIEFEDGSTIRLIPNSILTFTALRLRDDGSRSTVVDLRDGTGYFSIQQREDDGFQVTVASRTFTLDKTSQFRVVYASRQDPIELRVAVTKGELRFVSDNGQLVSLRKQETLTLDFSDAGRYFLAKGITEDAHDYWDRGRASEREKALARYSVASYSSSGIYISDLNRYGNYFTASGYGRVWQPYGVALSWDPFATGDWVYYPGAGFVWVSNYIWGFTPYRYGSWVYVNTRGWCWQPPGTRREERGWAHGPVLINPPRGYVRPVVPVVPVFHPGDRNGPSDRRGDFGVVRVGPIVDSSPTEISTGYAPRDDSRGSRILIQDRLNGVSQVDRPATADTGRSGGERRVGRQVPDSTGSLPEGDAGGSAVTDRGIGYDPAVKTGSRTHSEGEIGTQRQTEVPVINATPGNGATSATPPVSTDRPTGPQRFDMPSRIEQPVTPPARTMPTPVPTMSDRPMRTPRVDSPPPPRQDMSDRPSRTPRSDPPPQRASPPPPPPPSRSEPVRESAPREKAQPTIKDQ